MIKNKIICVFLLTLILLTFTGCSYTNTGIDNYYFVVSLAIDKTENDNLKVSIQIPASSKSSEGSGSSQASTANIYTVEAKTIDEAFIILDNYLNKKINLSHCSALIFSEEIAKEGIKEYIYTLSNNTELRHTCQLVVSSKTAYDVLEKISNSEESFSSKLFDYLTTSSDYTGLTISSTFGDFFQDLHDDNIQPTAIYTKFFEDTVQSSGIALFKDEFMITHVDSLCTLAHSICTNKLESATITIDNPFDEGHFVDLDIELYKKTDVAINIINGTPYIELDVYPKGAIRSSGSVFNYIDNDNITKLEDATNKYLKNVITDYLYDITKEYNTDVIGFKGICQSKYFTEDEFDAIHWDDVFQDSFFNVNVKSEINSSNLFNKE